MDRQIEGREEKELTTAEGKLSLNGNLMSDAGKLDAPSGNNQLKL